MEVAAGPFGYDLESVLSFLPVSVLVCVVSHKCYENCILLSLASLPSSDLGVSIPGASRVLHLLLCVVICTV